MRCRQEYFNKLYLSFILFIFLYFSHVFLKKKFFFFIFVEKFLERAKYRKPKNPLKTRFKALLGGFPRGNWEKISFIFIKALKSFLKYFKRVKKMSFAFFFLKMFPISLTSKTLLGLFGWNLAVALQLQPKFQIIKNPFFFGLGFIFFCG